MDAIVVEGEYYVRVSAQNILHQKVSIKSGDSFVISDRKGDLPRIPVMTKPDRAAFGDFPEGSRKPPQNLDSTLAAETPLLETGFYLGGTRHLSVLSLTVDGEVPILLSSSLSDDDVQLISLQSNPDITGRDGEIILPKDSILFHRELLVERGNLLQRIEVRNFHTAAVELVVGVHFDADFRDIFEVRGFRRKQRGEPMPPRRDGNAAVFDYQGLDGVIRRTVLRFSPAADRLDARDAHWKLHLRPGDHAALEIAAAAGIASGFEPPRTGTREAAARVRRENGSWDRTAARIFTSNERMNSLFDRAAADVRLMCTRTPDGLFPYAGIPWYACAFGRDALWTSLMTMSLQPRVSAGTLRFLARHQSEGWNDFVDAEPGKILHELRTGEMANLREIPFIPYYGTVDATPLFVVLLDRYVRWTGDQDLLEELWKHAVAALDWVRGPGDLDGDGFLEYSRRSPLGLENQGWKDSKDSVFHKDGRLAKGPIALVEAQAYAYAALRSGMRLARMRAEEGLAKGLESAAERLRARFEDAFWCESLGTYAAALDGEKRPCETVTSNPGHVLWSGIAGEERARRVAESLLSPRLFSGWGVRTVAEGQARYNPISYHNGSVWPHDNAVAAYGLTRYGHRAEAGRIAGAILDAGQLFDESRVPELFCGFSRSPRHAPAPYPVACSPQAWSAGGVFAMLESMIGMEVDGLQQRVTLHQPSLPGWLDWMEVTDLRVGSKTAHFRLERTDRGAVLERSSGNARIVVRD